MDPYNDPYRTQAEMPVEEQSSSSVWERLSEAFFETWDKYFFLRALAYASCIVGALCALIGAICAVMALCSGGHPVLGSFVGILSAILLLATVIYFIERK